MKKEFILKAYYDKLDEFIELDGKQIPDCNGLYNARLDFNNLKRKNKGKITKLDWDLLEQYLVSKLRI